jgi:hypothetical protein
MTALFVGNVGVQINQFLYRPLDGSRPISIEIPIYEQKRIGGELTVPEVNCIVQQFVPYGMRRADEAHLLGPFDSLIYSVGRPITVEQLQAGANRKATKLKEMGKIERLGAAIRTNANFQKEIKHQTKAFEMSFVEETPSGGFPESRMPTVEGVVVHDGGPPVE